MIHRGIELITNGKVYGVRGSYPCHYREFPTPDEAVDDYIAQAQEIIASSADTIIKHTIELNKILKQCGHLSSTVSQHVFAQIAVFAKALALQYDCDPFTAYLREGRPGFVCNGVRVQLTGDGRFRSDEHWPKIQDTFSTPKEAANNYHACTQTTTQHCFLPQPNLNKVNHENDNDRC